MIPADKPSPMDVFVKRPILALVVCAVLVLAGLRAAQGIAVLQFPRIESATLVISTVYTGASSDVVQGFVTEPIERVAASIPGVDYVDSNTTAGVSTVRVWLQLNHSTTAALAEAFVMGKKAGLDPQQIYDVLSVSTGASTALDMRAPRFISGDFSPGDAATHDLLGSIVQSAGCLIKQKNLGVSGQRTSDQKALPLPARKVSTTLTNNSVHPHRHGVDIFI